MKKKTLASGLLMTLLITSTSIMTSCSSAEKLPAVVAIVNETEEVTSLVLTIGETSNLYAINVPTDADQNVTWSSGNPSIVNIVSSGNAAIVQGLTVGETTVRATAVKNSRAYRDIKVTVSKPVTPTSILIKEDNVEIETLDTYVGDTNQLTAEVVPSSASQEVTWSSGDPNIASVSEDGLLTSNSVGTTIITATSKVDSTITETIIVNVKEKEVPYSNFYLVGYGSFQQGANYSYNGGYRLKEDADYNGDYDYHYYIEDAEFTIGDSFEIKNSETNYIVSDYVTNSGSFVTNNVALDSEYKDEIKIDVCKTGKYTVDLYQKNGNYSCSITNGTGTTANSLEPYSGTANLKVLSFGDYHGNVDDVSTSKLGIARYVSAIKSKKQEYKSYTPILINNGDMWQGSYYSNNNYGALLNEALSEAGCDAFGLGNHEFDWGQSKIATNQANSSIPYLGANIVHYNDTKEGRLHSFVQPYTIVEKQNLRIGIIGLIGTDQITSITSSFVKDVSFSDDTAAIKKYSDKLRKTFGCEVVIVSDHVGTSDGLTNIDQITATSSVSGKRYCDMIIYGHDHSASKGSSNYVPYVNSGSNGSYLSCTSLSYNNGTVTGEASNISLSTSSYAQDSNTLKIIDQYITSDIKQKASSNAGTIDNDFGAYATTGEAPRMMAKAMYEYAKNKGHDIKLAIVNKARTKLSQGTVSFADLFSAFPFTNKVVVMSAKGKDIKKEAKYNLYYGLDTSISFEDNKYYLIATYDYLAYHQNENRAYDYFSNGFTITKEYDEQAPVDIIYDYMKKQTGTIKKTDYQTTNFTFLNS